MLYRLGNRAVRTEGEYWVADNAVVVGSVLLKADASVWFNAVLRGDNELSLVAENKVIPDNSMVLGTPGKVVKRFLRSRLKVFASVRRTMCKMPSVSENN